MILVVNKSKCSRGVYIGRGSPLGNPFSHRAKSKAAFRVVSRHEAVKRYRGWLEEQLEDPNALAGKAFLNLVEFYRDYGELTLVCYCKPLDCHGDVIKEMIEERVPCPISPK